MSNVVSLRNRATRSLREMFPRFFGNGDLKHDHYFDFGFPAILQFSDFYQMYRRNGIAKAAVNKTVEKIWETNPYLLEKERDGSQGGQTEETPLELSIRQAFARIRLWGAFNEVNKRAYVGQFAALILQFRDGLAWDQPVVRVPGGLDGLRKVFPAWQGELSVSMWDEDINSETYGEPLMYQYSETAMDKQQQGASRQINIHPSRVIIWSDDGTLNGQSLLEAGYNDLITLEKIIGSGGEGFWKNAKSAPVLEAPAEADMGAVARSLGMEVPQLLEKMEDQVESWSKGFDKMLMLQGIVAKNLQVQLPSPEHFFNVALQSFAASISMPTKILVGMQTGERASTEDANEWSQTNNGRRETVIIPNIMMFVTRLVDVGILPKKDWHLDWIDLTESSMSEKIDRANKMADVNQKVGDEWVFTPEEIRAAVGYEPLSAAEAEREIEDDPENDPDNPDPEE